MKKKIETKNDGKEFQRFEQFVSEIIKVPKDVILKREQEEKRKNEVKRARKT